MRFDQQFIKTVIPEASFLGSELPSQWGISIDSRSINKGDLFFALKGNKVDGHDFIKDAISNGAIGLVINNEKKDILKSINSDILKSLFIVIVPNTRQALIKFATAWRKQFSYPVIGITGSIGKTSTKEILSSILQLHNVPHVATYANQNTELGVAINILRIRSHHKVALFEMATNKRGEMAQLAHIVQPTTAIITTVGHSHMEGLGSLHDIANEKRDIFKYFKEDNIGIINGDLPILTNISYNHPIVKFGYKTTNQVQARKIQVNNTSTHFILKLYREKYNIILNTNHEGRIFNALAAATCAYLLQVPSDVIVKGIQIPLALSGRFVQAKLKASKGFLIDDCYNASPESMKAALLAFEKVESKGQKIAVLGDMLELGVNSPFWHRQLGRFLRKVPSLDYVVLVGNHVKWTKDTVPLGLKFEHVLDWKEASNTLKKCLEREAVILVKGSQSLGLKNLVTELAE